MKRISDLTTTLDDALQPGSPCEVRRRYDDGFARGFEVAELVPGGYRVKRMSDGAVLPVTFSPADVQPSRAGSGKRH